MESLQRYSNSLTTQMTFGWRTISNQDPKLTILFESLDRFEHLTQTGIAAVVDFFPILQALPGFLMPLKAFATKIYDDQKGLYVGHWLEVKSAIKAGTSKPCLSVDLAKLQDEEGFSDEQAAFISGKCLPLAPIDGCQTSPCRHADSSAEGATNGVLMRWLTSNRYCTRGWFRNNIRNSVCLCASYDPLPRMSEKSPGADRGSMW